MKTRMNETIRHNMNQLVIQLIDASPELVSREHEARQVLDSKLVSVLDSRFNPLSDKEVLRKYGVLATSSMVRLTVTDKNRDWTSYHTGNAVLETVEQYSPRVPMSDVQAEYDAWSAIAEKLETARNEARAPYKNLISKAYTVEDVVEAWPPAKKWLGPTACTAIALPIKAIQEEVRADWEGRV